MGLGSVVGRKSPFPFDLAICLLYTSACVTIEAVIIVDDIDLSSWNKHIGERDVTFKQYLSIYRTALPAYCMLLRTVFIKPCQPLVHSI